VEVQTDIFKYEKRLSSLGNVQISYDASGKGVCSNRQRTSYGGGVVGQIVILLL